MRVLSPRASERARVSQPDPSGTGNILLGVLSSDDYALLQPHMTRVPFDRGLKLVTPGEPIKQVYFPEGGVASIVSVMEASGRTEAGIFGREGVSATGLLLDTDRSPHKASCRSRGPAPCASRRLHFSRPFSRAKRCA
jgi:CRP-like cAMP-binding protein